MAARVALRQRSDLAGISNPDCPRPRRYPPERPLDVSAAADRNKGDPMATPTAEISADTKNMFTDVYLTPAYVAVGLTDVAVEKIREANLFDPIQMRKELSAQAEKVVKQAQQAPATLLKRGRRLSEAAQADYVELAERGEQLIERIRGQQATQLKGDS